MANNEELLKILDGHGRKFLNSFALPSTYPSAEKRKRHSNDEEAEEEWQGIQTTSYHESGEDFDGTHDGFEQNDDGFLADSSNIVVFSDPGSKKCYDPASKTQMKAFMSSRISRLTSDKDEIRVVEQDESDEERSNVQNDALLHRLVHTQLLSGSRSTELDLTPAQRRKALAGRILELAGTEKLGKGEKAVIQAERRRAGKQVREGLVRKQKEREQHRLEEAKILGNYHPAIKNAFESSSKTKSSGRRNRGLRMGVGRFDGGVLKLSKEDISKVEGGHSIPGNTDRRRRVHRGRR